MQGTFSSFSVAVLVVCAQAVLAWTPPPPEFPDQTAGSGVDFPGLKWIPALGAPTSLLDILPLGSPAAGDFNRDSFPDLFFPATQYTDEALNDARSPRAKLFFNDGSTTNDEIFYDVTDLAGLDVRGFAYAASWADADNDRWPDLFVGGYRMARLFHNNHDNTFSEATTAVGLPQDGFVLGGAFGDYDADGDLDLFLVQFAEYQHPDDGLPVLHDLAGRANVLLRQNADGTFTDVSATAGIGAVARRSTSASFVDVDVDGRLDIYVTNLGQPAELWRNNGDGTFTERASTLGLVDGLDATCQAWEDIDRDGRLDLYVGHEDGAADGLFLARTDGTFEDRSGTGNLSATSPGRAWGCVAFDYDGDADMDLLSANGDLQGSMRQRSTLMMNQLDEGAGLAFADITPEAGDHDLPGMETLDTIATPLAASGVAQVDWNLDATPDVVMTTNDGDHARMFENLGWVTWTGTGDTIKIVLDGVQSNEYGLGARVTVEAGHLHVTRQVGSAMSWGGQSLTETQFGLMKPIEGGYENQQNPVNVTIQWPSGQVDVHHGLPGGRFVEFKEGAGFTLENVPGRPFLSFESGTRGEHGWWVSPTVQVRVTAFDPAVGGSIPSGLASARFSLDGVSWMAIVEPSVDGVLLTFSGDGTHVLHVEATDLAGNSGLYTYPIRIDSTVPGGSIASPRPGSVNVQGREILVLPTQATLGRAIVVAPIPADFSPLGEPGQPVDEAVGSNGIQWIRGALTDAASGIGQAQFKLLRNNGNVIWDSGPVTLGPFEAPWPANATAAGEYRLVTSLKDVAGNTAQFQMKLEVIPSGAAGILSTVNDGPSLPML